MAGAGPETVLMADGNPMPEAATGPMLRARASLQQALAGLERHVRQMAQDDPACRRLMSMPGLGAVVALTCRSAVDDPARFTSSTKVGPWAGMTPSRNRSGERDVCGSITKAGDVSLRRALCQAATVLMYEEGQKTVRWTVFPAIGGRPTWLRTWAAPVARRRGATRAMGALARRISGMLHRMGVMIPASGPASRCHMRPDTLRQQPLPA